MRVGVLTSGGDAPGMNACIDRLRRGADARGWTALGIRQGWLGLLAGAAEPIDPALSARFARLGGTWLGVSRPPDLRERMTELEHGLARAGLDALVVLGGDGSLRAAGALSAAAHVPVVGIPATIDNDIAATDLSLGFDTALQYAIDACDRARDTAESLPRCFAVETLGGPTGHIALAVGQAVAADAILLPEEPLDEPALADAIRTAPGAALVVASEGVPSLEPLLERAVAAAGTRLRLVRLGHAQRGGSPTARDRALAAATAALALNAVAAGTSGVTALRDGALRLAPFTDAVAAPPPDRVAWRGLL